jgi:choline dehydrogenase-like flavoprotein
LGKKSWATGGGRGPTMRNMVDYYMKNEIEDRLRQEKGIGEGEKVVFEIGDRARMAGLVQGEIMNGPGRARDRERLERKKAEWEVMGYPSEVQKRYN